MTFGFKELPEIVLDYQIFVGTSEGAKINIGVLLPIKSIMHRVLNEKFTHPNCRCIGLEMGSLERNAIQGSTRVHVTGLSGFRHTTREQLVVELRCGGESGYKYTNLQIYI